MKKTIFTISILLNLIFIVYTIYHLGNLGGLQFIKKRLGYESAINTSARSTYYKTKKDIFEAMPNKTGEVLFVGNSIVDYVDWSELFESSLIKNRGISGDNISGVLERLDEITESKPKSIFLLIGINDIAKRRSVQPILQDYEGLIREIISRAPETRIVLQSILPTNNKGALKNSKIIEVNKGIESLASKYNLEWVDLFSAFKMNDNSIHPDLSFDGLHLNGKGVLLWKEVISKYLK